MQAGAITAGLSKGIQIQHIPLEIFKKIAGEIVRGLRNSKKAPGYKRIYTAGEKEHEMELERQKIGIPVNSSILEELLTMQKELALKNYTFQ